MQICFLLFAVESRRNALKTFKKVFQKSGQLHIRPLCPLELEKIICAIFSAITAVYTQTLASSAVQNPKASCESSVSSTGRCLEVRPVVILAAADESVLLLLILLQFGECNSCCLRGRSHAANHRWDNASPYTAEVAHASSSAGLVDSGQNSSYAMKISHVKLFSYTRCVCYLLHTVVVTRSLPATALELPLESPVFRRPWNRSRCRAL